MDEFTSLKNLSSDEIHGLLKEACALESRPDRQRLQGKVLGLLFMNPSVRTLASFQSAMARLGGSSFVISPGQSSWGMEWRANAVMDGKAAEHLREALPVLEEYADALGLRCFAQGENLADDIEDPVLSTARSLTKKPFINMESAIDHPCQALADWKTLDDLSIGKKQTKVVLSWADHPNPLPLAVPASTLDMAARRGMDVTVLAPSGFALPQSLIQDAKKVAKMTGGSVRETSDRSSAMEDAQVLYAKSWQAPIAYGDAKSETRWRKAAHDAGWTVGESWFDRAKPGAKFMHCLPVRRNVVVEDSVLDGSRSLVTIQAKNRLYVQMAILCQLLDEK